MSLGGHIEKGGRFTTGGNVWIGEERRLRGWRVVCKCGVNKTVAFHTFSSVPASMVVKKFTQAGWYIGRKEEDDMCPQCRMHRKPKKEKPVAAPPIAAPPQAQDLRPFLTKIRTLLVEGKVKEAIEAIDAANGTIAAQAPSSFAKWLEETHEKNGA